MERVKKYQANLGCMLKDLEVMLNKLDLARNNPAKYDSDDLKAYRNSVIKSFELSFELFWKMLKEFLYNDYGIQISSPKGVIHQCLKQEFLSEDETKLLLTMVDIRNVTTHDYDKDMAEEISKYIPTYYKIMCTITSKIK